MYYYHLDYLCDVASNKDVQLTIQLVRTVKRSETCKLPLFYFTGKMLFIPTVLFISNVACSALKQP